MLRSWWLLPKEPSLLINIFCFCFLSFLFFLLYFYLGHKPVVNLHASFQVSMKEWFEADDACNNREQNQKQPLFVSITTEI